MEVISTHLSDQCLVGRMISSVGDGKTQIKAGEAGFPGQVGTNNPQVHKIRSCRRNCRRIFLSTVPTISTCQFLLSTPVVSTANQLMPALVFPNPPFAQRIRNKGGIKH